MHRRVRARHLALLSGLPEDALSSGARITMMGRGCVLVEGQHGVVELGANRIRLRTSEGILCVSGCALALRELSLDAALISGKQIDTASYARPEREG
ncbi:MAG: YabP/YqfC family sporulation protein [Clostridia bacterium]|nr:YabP/YqfC family sporulation protein [Clostridia bacterium]